MVGAQLAGWDRPGSGTTRGCRGPGRRAGTWVLRRPAGASSSEELSGGKGTLAGGVEDGAELVHADDL